MSYKNKPTSVGKSEHFSVFFTGTLSDSLFIVSLPNQKVEIWSLWNIKHVFSPGQSNHEKGELQENPKSGVKGCRPCLVGCAWLDETLQNQYYLNVCDDSCFCWLYLDSVRQLLPCHLQSTSTVSRVCLCFSAFPICFISDRTSSCLKTQTLLSPSFRHTHTHTHVFWGHRSNPVSCDGKN